MDIDPTRERRAIDYASNTAPTQLPAPTAARPDVHAVIDSIAAQPLAASTVRDASAGNAIDATRDAYAGPYQAEGKTVSSPVMFKLSFAYDSQTKVKELKGLVGESLAQRVQSGQAGPTEITRATQILIDRGKLPAEPAGDLGARIKTMQWQYGIGIDCACFTRHAAASAIGRTSIPVGNDLGMRQLDSNAHFSKVKPGQVRPGDIMTLDAKPPETIGHNVIVRNNDRLSDLEGREKAVANPELTSFFVGKGPFHSISVDSSWGAGEEGSLQGGYRRETWLFDESTNRWAHQDPETKTWKVATNAPTDFDTFHGAYRVRS